MAKDPAFLFYPGDWLGGTMGMTFEQKGAYFEMLIFQFNNGPFTEAQAKQVLSICSASVWQVVRKKFSFDGGTYFNKRLSDEITKRKAFSESRRDNAKSKKIAFESPKAYAQHMENENEIKDRLYIEVNDFLKRKGSNTMDVRMMVQGWLKVGCKDIIDQLKAMKACYQKQGQIFPTKIETLTKSFTDSDWIQKLKELDPQRIAENIQNTKNGKRTDEPDTIGTSAPGSLG